MFAQDRDLLALDPNLFRDVAWSGQRLVSGVGNISGTTLTLTSQDVTLEAAAITAFVMDGVRIRPGAAVLDLHEDPVYEAPDYKFEGSGSYIYVTGAGAMAHPASRRVRDCLERSRLPLVREGVTRFGERLTDGIIVDTTDGSIDELLARRLGCSPVITVENLLHAPDSPPLAQRVEAYLEVLDAFFGASGEELPCAPPS